MRCCSESILPLSQLLQYVIFTVLHLFLLTSNTSSYAVQYLVLQAKRVKITVQVWIHSHADSRLMDSCPSKLWVGRFMPRQVHCRFAMMTKNYDYTIFSNVFLKRFWFWTSPLTYLSKLPNKKTCKLTKTFLSKETLTCQFKVFISKSIKSGKK